MILFAFVYLVLFGSKVGRFLYLMNDAVFGKFQYFWLTLSFGIGGILWLLKKKN